MPVLPLDCLCLLDKESPLDFAIFAITAFRFLELLPGGCLEVEGKPCVLLYLMLGEIFTDANYTSVLSVSCEMDNFFFSLCNLTLSLHFLLSTPAFLGLRAFFLLSLFRTLSFSLYALIFLDFLEFS